MNPREANDVLDRVQRGWPGELDANEVAYWLDRLVGPVHSYDAALSAIESFVDQGTAFRPSMAEFVRRLNERERWLAEQRALPVGQRPPCDECGDPAHRGWMVVVSNSGEHVAGRPDHVRPCSRCNPVGYQLWAKGHNASGHVCRLCHAIRRGKGTDRDEAIKELLDDHLPVDLDSMRVEEPF